MSKNYDSLAKSPEKILSVTILSEDIITHHFHIINCMKAHFWDKPLPSAHSKDILKYVYVNVFKRGDIYFDKRNNF